MSFLSILSISFWVDIYTCVHIFCCLGHMPISLAYGNLKLLGVYILYSLGNNILMTQWLTQQFGFTWLIVWSQVVRWMGFRMVKIAILINLFQDVWDEWWTFSIWILWWQETGCLQINHMVIINFFAIYFSVLSNVPSSNFGSFIENHINKTFWGNDCFVDKNITVVSLGKCFC